MNAVAPGPDVRHSPSLVYNKRELLVIARIWNGWTTQENANRYQQLLTTQVLPDIEAQQIPGYRGADLLRHVEESSADEVKFVTVLWFDSLDQVREFTGQDYAVAHVPAEARQLLARYDARSEHYDHILGPGADRPSSEDP